MKEIARRRPVDSTAAKVTAEGPKGLESRKCLTNEVVSPTPPQMRQIPRGVPDMRGRTFGLFTVVGLAVQMASDGVRWVVRCACGTYSLRSTKSVRNPKNATIDRCERCRQVAFLRRQSEYQQLGYNTTDKLGL